MSINSSLNQISGGIAAIVAGKIVTQSGKGAPLQHYNILGYVVVAVSLISIALMCRVNKFAIQRAQIKQPPSIRKELIN